ncbi:hypothetical protein HKX48_004975 [Thoreauomyces humboldtii]|nr:hypothetical protein HKX48_004975 [Thoreauomyces humboldtii]
MAAQISKKRKVIKDDPTNDDMLGQLGRKTTNERTASMDGWMVGGGALADGPAMTTMPFDPHGILDDHDG